MLSVLYSETKAWIRVNCWAQNETLDFLVENSLCRYEVDVIETINTNGGIGLQNIKKRLGLIYPETHSLKIEEDETYLVHLKLELPTL